MDNTQKFPFVRNRYYYGKMLTSGDFEAEQRYLNTKREFLNQMVLGSGILCGLNVYNLDDLSVLIESGAAIDPQGREIVVEESTVQKLAAIRGYDELEDEVLGLYIRRCETEIRPVYAGGFGGSGKEYENNQIQEGVELYLEAASKREQVFRLDSEFFVEAPILKNEDVEVSLRMPALACKGKRVKLEILVKVSGAERLSFSMKTILRLPVFTAADGTHSLEISLKEEALEARTGKSYPYWLWVEETGLAETHLLLVREQTRAEAAGRALKIVEDTELTVRLTGEKPEGFIKKQLGRTSLELYQSGPETEGVHLADLYMNKTPAAYTISRVEGPGESSYLTLPAREEILRDYLSFYADGKESGMPSLSQEPRDKEVPERPEAFDKESPAPQMAEGMLEIPLDAHMKRGSICFSQEVVHGLGPGSVYVAVGIADTGDAAGSGRRAQTVVYGNMELFAGRDMEETSVETAVKVYRGRGSFQVAAKLIGEQHTVLLSVHWIAVRMPEQGGITEEETKHGRIIPTAPTFSVRPKETYFLEVQLQGIKDAKLVYEVMDTDGGRVEEDGTYTAPARPGVYEIRIRAAGHPEIGTYVYAVVERGPAS